jgi:tetratricopeptide (TPR) repeat protein
VLPLSPVQKRVMVCLACHPGPVPVGWIPGIAGLDDGAASAALHDLRLRHLLEPVDENGTPAVRTTSRTLEHAVLRGVEAKELLVFHRAYAERLAARVSTAAAPPADALRMLALHQEGSGDERAAYRTRRRLFKDLWKRRAYGEVEQICRDALAPHGIRFGLARAYLRELVNVLWAQNMTAHAYHDMKAFGERFGEVPRGLLPKYCRGLMDARGPKAGLEFIEEALKKAQTVNDVLVARIEVEHALCLYNLSRYKIGLKAAAKAQELVRRLSHREQCRLAIYWALLQPGVGTRTAGRYLATAHHVAVTHRFADELALIQALRSIVEVNSGRPEQALRIIAKSLRPASRNRLVLRQYQLYAQAASAYSEIGDYERAIRCREKTLRMAQYLGQEALLASSWWRVAYFSELHGAFGNAIRYYDRAMPLLRRTSRTSDFVQASVLRHEVHSFVSSKRAGVLGVGAARALSRSSEVGEQGSLTLVGGDQMLRAGKWDEARARYAIARVKCLEGGRRDDAMRATAGEARAVLSLGDHGECERLLAVCRGMYHGIQNIDARARFHLVELLLHLARRRSRRSLSAILDRCGEIAAHLQMSTRLDLLPAVFRGYARIGRHEDAIRYFEEYEHCIRNVVGNLEEQGLARRFLHRVGYQQLVREVVLLERSGAHIRSVDVDTNDQNRRERY